MEYVSNLWLTSACMHQPSSKPGRSRGLHYDGDTKPHQDLIPTRLPELNDIFNKCQSEFYTNFSKVLKKMCIIIITFLHFNGLTLNGLTLCEEKDYRDAFFCIFVHVVCQSEIIFVET